jgi:hypothetical protein
MATTVNTTAPLGGSEPQEPRGPIYVDTQHDDMVHDAQLDYYGAKLATSSSGMFMFVNIPYWNSCRLPVFVVFV